MAVFQAKYPLKQMDEVGDFFFVPLGRKQLTRYFTKRAKELGIKLKIEHLVMERPGSAYGWQDTDNQSTAFVGPDRAWGVKVTRVA